jgi:Kef-type K+ transport system membrane component KefB
VPHDDFVRLLAQLAVLLAAATILGRVANRLRAPAVVGELTAGIVLGPSILGAIAPGVHDAIFGGDASAASRDLVGRLGLLAFVFIAGLELEWTVLRRRAGALAWTAGLGIALPFASGAALGWWLAGDPRLSPRSPGVFAVMMGTALSISALPVIARILFDLELHGTRTATLVLAAASFDDWIGWCLFGVVAGVAGTVGASAHPAAACLAAAAVAEGFGTHALFGVFLLGACFAQGAKHGREPLRDALEPFVTGVLAPLFFAKVGLGIDLGRDFDLGLTAVVIAVATAGKVVGAGLGARLGGLAPREALAVGVAMNARDAMEVVLASAARESGLIGESLYVALVVMALASSLAAGPCLARLLPAARTVRAGSGVPGTAPSPA